MTQTVAEQVAKWLGKDRSAAGIERCARWMRDSLRLGGIKDCRELVREALQMTCSHPATRLYTWVAVDGVRCVSCCDCGTPLAGAA